MSYLENHPLPVGERSSHVGFRRSTQFSATLFPHSGFKPTLRRMVGLV